MFTITNFKIPISGAAKLFYCKTVFRGTLLCKGMGEKQWTIYRCQPCPKWYPVKVKQLVTFNRPPFWPGL